MKKLILILLLTTGIFASREIEPVQTHLLKSNYVCLQRPTYCACCEEFFGDCRRLTLIVFQGTFLELEIPLREIRIPLTDDADL